MLSYTITPYLNGVAQTPTKIAGTPPATTATVTGLTNGANYTFTVKATNALGTSGETAPSAAIKIAPNAVANPGFEAGLTQWSSPVRATTTSAHTGTGSVHLKGDTSSGSAYFEQTVTVPSTGTPTLSYWYDYRQARNGASIQADVYSVTGTARLASVPGPPLAANAGWKQVTADLSAYRGQTVRLRMSSYVSYDNDLYVDDIVLR